MTLSKQNIRSIAMPIAMIVGALLCRPLSIVEEATKHILTPILIAAMLFVTFCRVDIKAMRPRMIHLWMLIVQFVGSIAVYYITLPLLGECVAQGAMICVMAPIAMAAVVIGGMLGADINTMATYSLICNIVTAIVAPFLLHAFGNGSCSFVEIAGRVVPTLVAPFVVAQLLRWVWSKAAAAIAARSSISFYLWIISLVLVLGRTTTFILDTDADPFVEVELAIVALVLCLAQFAIGRLLGSLYGDKVAGGQSVGQKNTILAVWMSLNFLNPVSSVAPTAYIVWQNLVNSYQVYRTGKRG